MSILTVRDLDPEVTARLRARAARHRRSMQAEVRAILAAAVASTDERPSWAQFVLDAFTGIDVELPDFDRATDQRRPVEL